MVKRILLVYFLFISFTVTKAQINVSKVALAGLPASSDGIFYALPLTVIQADIIIRKIQKVKGPYAEFADQMLGLSQVIPANSTEYELQDIKLTSFSEPDPSEYYFVKIPEKQRDRKAIEIFLNDEGVISGVGSPGSIAKSRKQKSIDLSASGISMPEVTNPSVIERMDTVIKRISLDSTIIEQKFFRKTSTAKSAEQKAREASEFILKLDENMYNLITGYQEVNYEKGTMEYMYNRMNSMKMDYLELFKGVTNNSTETFTFYFIADKSNPTEDLCRFSSSKGILPSASASGDLVQIQATSLDKTSILNAQNTKQNINTRESHGLFYRFPDKAVVDVKVGGQVKLEARFIINQFGIVTFLPASSIRNIGIDNNTGTLRHIVLE